MNTQLINERRPWTIACQSIQEYVAREDARSTNSPFRIAIWRIVRPCAYPAFLIGEPLAMFGVPAVLIRLAQATVSGFVSVQAGKLAGYGLIVLLAGIAAINWLGILRSLRLRFIDPHRMLVTFAMTASVPFALWLTTR